MTSVSENADFTGQIGARTLRWGLHRVLRDALHPKTLCSYIGTLGPRYLPRRYQVQ